MSTVHDEGCGGAPRPGARSSDGVQSHPFRVVLQAGGWSCPIGWGQPLRVERIKQVLEEGKSLTWDRLELDEIKLSRPAALLVVQGLSLNQLFPPDLALHKEGDANPLRAYLAPILLLKRAMGQELPGALLRNVILGAVLDSSGLSEEEIQATLLADVLSP